MASMTSVFIYMNQSKPEIHRPSQIIVFGDKIVMVLELAGHGDLLEYIKLRGALDERRSRRLVVQIIAAIEYLHARNIVHR